MKKTFTFLIAFLCLYTYTAWAQTDPGTDNLMHQWTFDNANANDLVGSANGTLVGAASFTNRALNTSDGGYVSFPGETIALNTYDAITTEIWFTSSSGANGGNTMLSYFGDANVGGSLGANYLFSSPSNGGNCRVAVSTGNTSEPWTVEAGINSSAGAIDDGELHHMVSVIQSTGIKIYIDGVNTATITSLSSNSISAISDANAFLCKSGYSSDPTWKGEVHKYSIYNKALSVDEVQFIFEEGAEESSFISSSEISLAFDEIITASTVEVSASNLSEAITISAPEGITVSPETLASDASAETVSVSYDGSTIVDGLIIFTSGTVILEMPVKASPNSECFTPLYDGIENLILNPYMNSINGSWGNVSVYSGADVYCGSQCVKITGTGSCYPDGGSIASDAITWLPNTTYRFHAMVKTMDGSFNMGVQNANINGGSGDYDIAVPDTKGEWAVFDATFTTGSSPSSGAAYFNNCGLASGLVAYIDNWELYAVPGISVTETELYLDEYSTTTSFNVSGVALSEAITISSPEGITIDPATVESDASLVTVNVTYDGSTVIDGLITLTSGTYESNITVMAYSNEECFTPLYMDKTNLIVDPYLSSVSGFVGLGKSLNSDPDYSYCGVNSAKVSNGGSIRNNLTGVMKPNTTYQVKAKVYRKNPGNVTYNLAVDPVANPTEYELIKTAMDSACYYFNKYTPFSANIYVYYNSGIPTAQASYYGSIGFGSNQRYMWVGTAMHEMDHYFGSGTSNEWWALMTDGTWDGSSANALGQEISSSVIYGDSQHFWPHGINQKEEITGLGGQAAQEEGLINSVKIAKAMLVDDSGLVADFSPVGIGVYGWSGTEADIYYEVDETEEWQDIDFTFTTGETLGSSQGVYFGNGTGYIDNWEMYEISSTTSVGEENAIEVQDIYLVEDHLMAEFNLLQPTQVDIAVYDIQGKMLLQKTADYSVGNYNVEINVSDLSKGIYIVKMTSKDFNVSRKVFK